MSGDTFASKHLQTAGTSSENISYLLGELQPIINDGGTTWSTSPERLTLYLDDMEAQAQHLLDSITALRNLNNIE